MQIQIFLERAFPLNIVHFTTFSTFLLYRELWLHHLFADIAILAQTQLCFALHTQSRHVPQMSLSKLRNNQYA